MTETEEFLGTFAIDSGRVLLTDPAYVLAAAPHRVGEQALETTNLPVYETVFERGHVGAGLVIKTCGDGRFKVYGTVERDSTGQLQRIKSVRLDIC